MEHENGVQALKAWLSLQEEKLKKKHRIEDVASVQNALKDCQVVEQKHNVTDVCQPLFKLLSLI